MLASTVIQIYQREAIKCFLKMKRASQMTSVVYFVFLWDSPAGASPGIRVQERLIYVKQKTHPKTDVSVLSLFLVQPGARCLPGRLACDVMSIYCPGDVWKIKGATLIPMTFKHPQIHIRICSMKLLTKM